MTYNRNLTALHKGLTPIHADQDRTNFAPKLAGGIRLLLEDGLSYLTFNNLYDTAYDSSTEGIDAGRNYIPKLDGTVWTISDIQGWWNLTDSSIPNIERGFGDGSFDVTGRLLARDLTITGSIIITDSSAASIAAKSKIVREKLLDSFNLVKRGTWLIVDEDSEYSTACFVRLSGKPEVSTVNSRGRIDFSIGLRAPNPTKVEWFPIESGGLVPEGFTTSDGNAYRYLKTSGGIGYYRNYSSVAGNVSGLLAYTSKTQSGTLTAGYASSTITISIAGGSTSTVSDGDYIQVTGLTYAGTVTGSTTGGFLVSGGTVAGTSTTIKYTAPAGTTGVSITSGATIVVTTVPSIPSASATLAISTLSATYGPGFNITANVTSGGTSLVQAGDYVTVTGLTYTPTSASTGPFLVTSGTLGATSIRFTPPAATTAITGTPVITIGTSTSPAFTTGVITLTINDGTSLVNDGDNIWITGLTYTNAIGSTANPFRVSGSTVVGGSTIKYLAPSGTTAISGTPLVTLQGQTDYYRTYPSSGNISGILAFKNTVSPGTACTIVATYASGTITLTSSDGTSLLNAGDYIYVTGLTYPSATGSTTGPFLVTGTTIVGGSTITFTAPISTSADPTGTPFATIEEQVSSYRSYSNTVTDNTSSGTFSVYNYGNTNVPCYIRFVGPLYGPALIKNTTTGQQIDILSTTDISGQVLYPTETNSLVQYLDIDTYTREVHKADAFNGIYTTSNRGSLNPLVDWIYLQPGTNDFYYEDKGASSTTGTVQIYWRSGWDR